MQDFRASLQAMGDRSQTHHMRSILAVWRGSTRASSCLKVLSCHIAEHIFVAERELQLAARPAVMTICCILLAKLIRLYMQHGTWLLALILTHITHSPQLMHNACAGSSVCLGASGGCAAHRALQCGKGSASQSQSQSRVQDLCSLEAAGSGGCCLHCRAAGTLCQAAQVNRC